MKYTSGTTVVVVHTVPEVRIIGIPVFTLFDLRCPRATEPNVEGGSFMWYGMYCMITH